MRRVDLTLVAAGLAFGAAAEWAALQPGELGAQPSAHALAVGDFLAGLSLIVCGVACRTRTPGSRTGLLLAAAGYVWFLGTLSGSGLGFAADVGAVFVTLHRGPLAHALLSYPAGRLPRTSESAVVAALYVWAAVPDLGSSSWFTLAAASVLVLGLARSFRLAAGPARRARGAALAAGLSFAVVLTAGSVATFAHAGHFANRTVLWTYQGVVAAIAVGLALDVVRDRWTRATVTGLVVELGRLPEPKTLRARLAAALGDPSLALGYRIDEGEGYVDEEGRPLESPAAGSGRELTVIRDADGPIAALAHDGDLLRDAELLGSVTEAARIAVSNVRLQSDIRRQVEEVDESRRRIVESADVERRRLERQLREGADRRLTEVGEILAGIGSRSEALDGARAELEHARAELRELAQGILPQLLTRQGLAPALDAVARRAGVPVELRVGPSRFPEAIEAAVYFVCSEALANIGKHAHAGAARIDVRALDGVLLVEVADNGVGGASLDSGSGLRGLSDRVEALRGSLAVESPQGRGTTLRVALPLT